MDRLLSPPYANLPGPLRLAPCRVSRLLTAPAMLTSRLSPLMSQMCRFISFSTLRRRIAALASVTGYLRPESLYEISESSNLEEVQGA